MKQLFFPLLCALLVFSLVLQSSCNPDDYGPCEEDPFETPDRSYISFSMVVPNTNEEQNLLDVLRYPCDRDSVKVYSEDGEVAEDYVFRADGRIGFRATNNDRIHELAQIQEVSRTFQLYINYREVHWIELRYQLREVKCRYDVFDYLEVYYDDELYSRSSDRIDIPSLLTEQNSLIYSRCQ